MKLICVILFVLYLGNCFGQQPNNRFEECQIVEQNGKFGILFGKQLAIPYEYDEIIPQYNSFFKVRKGNKYGIVSYFYSKDRNRFLQRNSYKIIEVKKGYVSFHTSIPCQYDRMEEFDDQYLLIGCDGKKGFLNHWGAQIVPCRFEKIEIKDGNIWVMSDNKHGVYNRYGSTILPCQFDRIEFYDGVYYVTRDTYQGIYNRYGSVIVPVHYTRIHKVGNSYWVEKGKLKGLMNQYGSTIIACQFDEIFREGEVYYVTRENKKGVYNHYGSVIIPARFDEVKNINNVYFVRNHQKYGIYNCYGSTILPCNFEKIEGLANGNYIATQGNSKKLYNTYGSFLGDYSEANVIYSTEKLPD